MSTVIDKANIPRKYGGGHDFAFGALPDLDPEIARAVEWLKVEDGEIVRKMPLGPMRWIRRDDGKKVAVAVGTLDGKRRREAVMAL